LQDYALHKCWAENGLGLTAAPFFYFLRLALDHQICEKAGELLAEARRAGKTVPLGDGLHAAVAELEDLTVATIDVDHWVSFISSSGSRDCSLCWREIWQEYIAGR
jgi:hypothetical protein